MALRFQAPNLGRKGLIGGLHLGEPISGDRQFALDMGRAARGFLALSKRRVHGPLITTMIGPVVGIETPQQDGRIANEDSIRDQRIVWHCGGDDRRGGKQIHGLPEHVGGVEPFGLGRNLSLDIDPSDPVAAQNQRSRLCPTQSHPGRFLHHGVHAISDLVGDGRIQLVHDHRLFGHLLEMAIQDVFDGPDREDIHHDEDKDGDVDQTE